MSTLRYADQAKRIVNSVKVNEDPFARTVRRLQEEVREKGGKAKRRLDWSKTRTRSGFAAAPH